MGDGFNSAARKYIQTPGACNANPRSGVARWIDLSLQDLGQKLCGRLGGFDRGNLGPDLLLHFGPLARIVNEDVGLLETVLEHLKDPPFPHLVCQFTGIQGRS